MMILPVSCGSWPSSPPIRVNELESKRTAWPPSRAASLMSRWRALSTAPRGDKIANTRYRVVGSCAINRSDWGVVWGRSEGSSTKISELLAHARATSTAERDRTRIWSMEPARLVSIWIRLSSGGCSRTTNWGGRTRTSNFPVNSRAVCQLTYTPREQLQDAKKPSCRTQGKRSYFIIRAMAIALATVTDSDLPEILTLLEASRLPVAGIREHLGSALGARENGKLVGCAAVEIYGSAGLLRSVAVSEERRVGGLGQP